MTGGKEIQDFRTPEFRLTDDLGSLVDEWEKLGIDPDDFLTCSRCHEDILETHLDPRGYHDCKRF